MGLNRFTHEGIGSIAQGTGLSASYVSRIFDGTRSPSMMAAERIASHLGISVGEFYSELQTVQDARQRLGAA
jgi:transcriptional regulator with XRE-family HTH domain